jgi:hypothetical protein
MTEHAAIRDGVAFVDVGRPESHQPHAVEVVLMDTRASDSIRIVYDFPRNGWSVLRPKLAYVQTGESSYEERAEWIEVHFSESWHFGEPEYP